MKVLVVGGAGYVGSRLVPELLRRDHEVVVYDLFLYGEEVFDAVRGHEKLIIIKGDVRDLQATGKAVAGCDAVIHLACISNDPSFELNPDLGRSINYDCFQPFVEQCIAAKVRRFVYASSSSVYGVSEVANVDEDHPLNPLTDYSRFKAECEKVLAEVAFDKMETLILRPATVCGYSVRQRLDLAVNILTNHAVTNGKILVFGGEQMRPNLHIDDMVDLYALALELPGEKISGKTYNAGYENYTVADIAKMVKAVVERAIPDREAVSIETTPSDDNRSYHITADKIKTDLGFTPKRTIEDAIKGLVEALRDGRLIDSMENPRYYNIRTMKERCLK
ncbi:MAG: UDP-glucose 4-epimerase [Elusimicrobia bacterium]|nr:MAG: UDP-glucose 4-epimerase [Elusimicrobiota bacterium]